MKKHVILCGMIALGVACAPLAMADEATDTPVASFRQGLRHHDQGESEVGGEAFVDVDPNQSRYRCGRRSVAERPGAHSRTQVTWRR